MIYTGSVVVLNEVDTNIISLNDFKAFFFMFETCSCWVIWEVCSFFVLIKTKTIIIVGNRKITRMRNVRCIFPGLSVSHEKFV